MKKHTQIGYKILSASNHSVLKAAAIVAHEHHEHWDGLGYPRGLKGEQIHISGRIVCLADVFDALGTRRTYKDKWSMDNIHSFIRQQRGKMFDPDLVDVFFDKADELLSVCDSYSK